MAYTGLDLPVVDTTGAGDALAAGFLDGLLFSGLSGEASLHRGQVLARLVCSAPGAAAGFDRSSLASVRRAAAAREPGPAEPSAAPEPEAGRNERPTSVGKSQTV